MNACASVACADVAVRPVPIAQTGSYATIAPSSARALLVEHRVDLAREHRFRDARLALREGLAHAEDRVRPARLRRGEFLATTASVLAEHRAALRVPDDRVASAESATIAPETPRVGALVERLTSWSPSRSELPLRHRLACAR
jgi:hypothetical protein